MKTVFILGAGASVACGAPLMRDFIPRAKRLQERNAYGEGCADIQEVLNAAYRDLRKVQAKSAIDYLNIEELFSAIDMGGMLGVFGTRPRSANNVELEWRGTFAALELREKRRQNGLSPRFLLQCSGV